VVSLRGELWTKERNWSQVPILPLEPFAFDHLQCRAAPEQLKEIH
jgi:hypothetical protein